MAQELIYPGSSSFFPGQTPFGIYDDDYVFQDDAPKMALWCARRLGFPIQNVELQDENFYACFEESVSEYSAQVNQFNIRNDLYSLKGRDTGTNYSGKLVEGSILPHLVQISDAYGTLVGVGGNTEIKKTKITLDEILNYLKGVDTLKVVYCLNNKVVIQKDEEFRLFSLKTEEESIRFIESLAERFYALKRKDCMFVTDTSTPQKKYLINLLSEKGFDKKMLYRKYTTYPRYEA